MGCWKVLLLRVSQVVAGPSLWNYSNNFSCLVVSWGHQAYWKVFWYIPVPLKGFPQDRVKLTLSRLIVRKTLALDGLMTNSKRMIAQGESNGDCPLQISVCGSELLVCVILAVAFKAAWKERLALQKSTYDVTRTLQESEKALQEQLEKDCLQLAVECEAVCFEKKINLFLHLALLEARNKKLCTTGHQFKVPRTSGG